MVVSKAFKGLHYQKLQCADIRAIKKLMQISKFVLPPNADISEVIWQIVVTTLQMPVEADHTVNFVVSLILLYLLNFILVSTAGNLR